MNKLSLNYKKSLNKAKTGIKRPYNNMTIYNYIHLYAFIVKNKPIQATKIY